MTLQLPLPPIPKTDKQTYVRLHQLRAGDRFVGIYQAVHTSQNIEHEIHLLDGQIVFLEGCSALRRVVEGVKQGDLVAFVYQGRRSFVGNDGKERSSPSFDGFVLEGAKWVPTFLVNKARQLTHANDSVIP